MEDKIKELEQTIKECQEKLEELKKEQELWPQDGDEYWYINDYGDAARGYWISVSCCNLDKFNIGNIFKTKEDAKRAVEGLKEMKLMRDRIEDGGEDFRNYLDDNVLSAALRDALIKIWGRSEQ